MRLSEYIGINIGLVDIILVLVISLALYFDLKEGRIPNKITVTAAGTGLLYWSIAGGLNGLYESFLGGLVGLVILLIPFVLGGMGAGDVKFLAAIGFLKGIEFVLYTAAVMGIVGGIIAIYYYFFVKLRGAYFPYGVAIAAGAVFTLGFL